MTSIPSQTTCDVSEYLQKDLNGRCIKFSGEFVNSKALELTIGSYLSSFCMSQNENNIPQTKITSIVLSDMPQIISVTNALNVILSKKTQLNYTIGIIELSIRRTSLRVLPVNLNEFSKLLFLDLSYNSLTSLGPTKLQLPNLLKLDVSHNRLQSLDYLQFLFCLNEIDASSNKLNSIQLSVGVLISLKNSLRVLNLKNNPVCKKNLYEKDVLFVLPFLSIFDNIEVYKIEKFCNNKKQMINTTLEVLNRNINCTQIIDTGKNMTKNEKNIYKKKVMVNGNSRNGYNDIGNYNLQSNEKVIPMHTLLSSNISYNYLYLIKNLFLFYYLFIGISPDNVHDKKIYFQGVDLIKNDVIEYTQDDDVFHEIQDSGINWKKKLLIL